MGLKSFFSGMFSKKNSQMTYARMLDGSWPIFSQFGTDIYASDIVQMAVDCIATEISKLQPRHIRTDANGIQTIPNSDINRLFKFAPNPIMTTKDFLEKVVWLLYMNYNCFIYPMYEIVPDSRGSFVRKYTGFYPLNPMNVTFLQDEANQLFVKMDFMDGTNFTLNYADVIHLRKRFSVNNIMGGGVNGQPDNGPLLKVLAINDSITQGLEKAIKTSLGVRGILKIATLLDDEKQQAERKRFEEAINASQSGVLPMDLKGEYIDLKPDPKVIDKDTIAFIQDKILYNIGVPLNILSGSFNDEQYQAFYEKTLEPVIISLGQAFSTTIFTQNELNHGNEMVFYQREMMYLSTASKLRLLEVAGAQGLLTDDQKLKILGYPPLADGSGSRRTQSLNYASTNIVDEYQLKRAGAGGLNPNNGKDNDKGSDKDNGDENKGKGET